MRIRLLSDWLCQRLIIAFRFPKRECRLVSSYWLEIHTKGRIKYQFHRASNTNDQILFSISDGENWSQFSYIISWFKYPPSVASNYKIKIWVFLIWYNLWPGTGSCFSLYLTDGGVFFRAFYGPIMTMTSLTLLAGGCACRDPLLPRAFGTTFGVGAGGNSPLRSRREKKQNIFLQNALG